MAKISPLHRVTGAARWDAERPLGRLIILAHAAFLDAGFVPAGADDDVNSLRLPRKIGRTASALPLRYAAPQLLHRPDAAAAAVKLRLCAHGSNLVFFVSITRTSMFREPWLDTYWVCLDALAAARLLFSGRLDDTVRALRRDARLAALWRALADGLCRRVLADLCTRNGVPLDPTFMSLPGDIKAAILARLADDEDLASVECTCAGLRRLVEQQDSTLWKPRYERLLVQLQLPGVLGSDGTMSWKEKYTAAASHGWEQIASMRERRFLQWMSTWSLDKLMHIHKHGSFQLFSSPEETVPRRRRRWRAMPRDVSCHGHAPLGHGGHKKQRHGAGAGAVHSPSSRFRCKHR